MATIVKQNVGIDQSKNYFKAAFATLDSEQGSKIKSSKRFDNNLAGYWLAANGQKPKANGQNLALESITWKDGCLF